MVVHELWHNSMHRVQWHPPGLGRAYIANTVLDAGQCRYRSATVGATHDQSGIQRGDGEDVTP
jgi:hypothetical protein